jgi:Acetyltransferase (GNAT) domain
MELRLLSSSELSAAAAAWAELERASGAPAIACSWAWTETWLEHYGDLVPHRFAVASDGGTPIGAALVTRGVRQRRARVPVRTLHLGTAGEPPGEGVFVQHNRLLTAPGARRGFAQELIPALAQEPGWDELMLDGFPPEDAADLLRAGPFLARAEACRTLDLRAAARAGGEVVAVLGPKTRKAFRRTLRGLAAPSGEWADGRAAARETLEDLIELHQARWQSRGRPGAFASARFSGFHRELVERLAGSGRISLFRVRDNEATVGCVYGFIDGNRLLSYQSGFAALADDRLSPGLVTDVLCMQACLERGVEVYDHLSGDSVYKQRLSTGCEALVWAALQRASARRAAAGVMGGVTRGVRTTRSLARSLRAGPAQTRTGSRPAGPLRPK